MNRSADPDPAALLRDGRVRWTRDVLRFNDTDLNGHVNNASFAVFCESGRVHLLHTVLGPDRDPDRFFVVARLEITFRRELHYPGEVRCGTWIARVGTTSLLFRQALLDDAGDVAATSEAVCVGMDGATRRPAPFGPGFRAAAETLVREA